MTNLLKKELFLLRKSKAFYFLVFYSIVSGLLNGAILVAAFGTVGPMGTEAYWTDTIEFAYLCFSTIFVCLFICGEFGNRSIQNDIRIGHSRSSIVLSRAFVVLPASALVWLSYSVSAVFSYALSGHLDEFSLKVCGELLCGVALSMLNVMALMSFCLLAAFVFKKITITLSVCVFLTFELMQLPLIIQINQWTNRSGFLMDIYKSTVIYRASIPYPLLDGGGILLTVLTALVTIVAAIAITCTVFARAELR